MFDDAAIGMATMTLQGRIVRANSALCRILGRRSERAPRERLRRGGRATTPGMTDATTAIVEKGADVVTLEHPQVGDAYRRTTLTVVRDRGRPAAVSLRAVPGRDAAADRRAGADDTASSGSGSWSTPSASTPSSCWTPTGHVTSWNVGAERAKGWTAAEIIGKHFRVFYPPEQQEARHPEHELEVAARDGVYQEEGWRVRKDGSRFWAHVTITKITDEDGHHIGFAKVTRDHTERMQMLEQRGQYANALAEANTRLEQANAELAAAAEEQSRFLAVTAHELRSPSACSARPAGCSPRAGSASTRPSGTSCWPGCRAAPPGSSGCSATCSRPSRLQAATLDLDLRGAATWPRCWRPPSSGSASPIRTP